MISHACQPLGVFKGGVSEIRKARGFHWTSAGGSLCCLQLGDNELALAEAGYGGKMQNSCGATAIYKLG